MKKYISNFLTLLFLWHFIVTVFINVFAFGFLKKNNRDRRLNTFGKTFVNNMPKYKHSIVLNQYANYSGLSRGYAFYSPNVRRIKNRYIINDSIKIEDIMTTKETKLKVNTLMVNLTDIVNNKEARKKIVSSFYKISQSKNKNLKNLNMDLEIIKFVDLENYNFDMKRDTTKRINAYKIIRNE